MPRRAAESRTICPVPMKLVAIGPILTVTRPASRPSAECSVRLAPGMQRATFFNVLQCCPCLVGTVSDAKGQAGFKIGRTRAQAQIFGINERCFRLWRALRETFLFSG